MKNFPKYRFAILTNILYIVFKTRTLHWVSPSSEHRMGYVTSGYPSRPHKRLLPINQKVYYENLTPSDERDKIRLPRKKPRIAKKRLTLNSLPQDIIQKIFIYSGKNNSLPFLNRFFYVSLRPNGILIEGYIWENYISDLNELLPENDFVPILDSNVFQNGILLKYLNENSSVLDSVFNVVKQDSIKALQRERLVLYEDGNLSDIRGSHILVNHDLDSDKPLQDFPHAFYNCPILFFHNDIREKPPVYNQFLLKLHSYFTVKQASWLCEMIVEWFFWKNDGEFGINHLFYALNLVLHLSDLSTHSFHNADVLISLIVNLYLEQPLNLQKLLLCEGFQDEKSILDRKARIIGKFIKKFYRDMRSVLSNDNLWMILHQIKEPSLAEVITHYGGAPSFRVLR